MVAVAAARTPLSRARVLDAAVAIADAQGPDALTLRRLAQALQVHPTSIYNHVSSKDAILDGVSERLIEEARLESAFTSWQQWVWSFATSMRTLARAHPGAFAVFTRRQAGGSAASEHVEAALGAFVQDGFSIVQANQAMAGVALAIMGLALNEAPPSAAAPDLTKLDAQRYPQMVKAATAVPQSTDGMWDLVIGALIHGLENSER